MVEETKITNENLESEASGSQTGSESFAELLEQSIKAFENGAIVEGMIVCIRDRDVLVDIGYKSEGIILKEEFSDPDELQVGEKVSVLLESSENDDGMIVISKKKADRIRFWDTIVSDCQEGSSIEGKIFKKVKGGFMVDIGMEAFLPASLVDVRPTRNLDQFIGIQTTFKIVKINHKRKNIVLSRKEFLEQELAENRNKILNEIKEGSVLKGRVKNITDFGAFIDLGGVDGLLHITDMSWGRVSHPSEMLSIGDEVEVMVISFDTETKRVSLGLKQKHQNPWEDADVKYPINSKVKGKVVNILPYGAFIELEKGIEGLVHISELSWTKKVNHPSEIINVGDTVEAIVLSVDKENRKIALGIKQTEVNPWLLVEEKYEIGSSIEGKVRNITDYGVFVELEPGIDGMIHISDISWLKKVNHPSEFFKKNQTVQAKVLSIDQTNRKISLGVKQLEDDPWKNLVDRLTPGQVVEGKVTKIVNFGIFIEIGDHLEGLVHISEIPENKAQSLESHYNVDDVINVMILKVDLDSRKIALTLKGELANDNAADAKEEQPAAEPTAPAVEQQDSSESSDAGDVVTETAHDSTAGEDETKQPSESVATESSESAEDETAEEPEKTE
jgi:small subunit ribosomal protein S1